MSKCVCCCWCCCHVLWSGEASIHGGGVGGFRLVEAKYPALLFKQQLDAFVQKIFPMMRDNVKKNITPMLVSSIGTYSCSRHTLYTCRIVLCCACTPEGYGSTGFHARRPGPLKQSCMTSYGKQRIQIQELFATPSGEALTAVRLVSCLLLACMLRARTYQHRVDAFWPSPYAFIGADVLATCLLPKWLQLHAKQSCIGQGNVWSGLCPCLLMSPPWLSCRDCASTHHVVRTAEALQQPCPGAPVPQLVTLRLQPARRTRPGATSCRSLMTCSPSSRVGVLRR